VKRASRDPWDAALRVSAPPEGPCLDEARIVAFYAGELDGDAAAAVRRHLAECASCLELAADARRFMESMEAPAPPAAAPVARGTRLPWLAAAASVALVLSAAWWWTTRRPATVPPGDTSPPRVAATPRNPWADLRVPKAAFTRTAGPDDLIWRDPADDAPAPPRADAFAQAMRAYERDDYALAEARLASVVAREPARVEAHFYRGVCLLLMERVPQAVASLETAMERAGRPPGETVSFYLALAYLKAGDPERALPLLEALRGSSRFRSEAERLRQQIAPRPGSRSEPR
jgi:hypothetical protein